MDFIIKTAPLSELSLDELINITVITAWLRTKNKRSAFHDACNYCKADYGRYEELDDVLGDIARN